MRKLLILIAIMVLHVHAIVTIKPLDVGEKATGVSGSVTTSYSINKGNTDLSAIDVGGLIQLDSNSSVSFVQGDYRRGDAEEELTIHQGFMHLRHIHNLNTAFDGEAFIQEQFNAFIKLISRTLIGAGGRFNFGDAQNYGKGYLGIGGFYVLELEEAASLNAFTRVNIYLSYKYNYTKLVNLAVVNYYQPRVDDFTDLLILSKGQLEVKLNEALSLILSMSFNYDSKPATGVKEYDIAQRTALKISF